MALFPQRVFLLERCRGFRSEDGAATVESVVVFPIVFLLSVAVSDTLLVFMHHASAIMLFEDATRALVVGELTNCAEFVARVQNALHATMPSASATCETSGQQSYVSLSLAASEMGIGVIPGFVDGFQLSSTNIKTHEYLIGA